MEDTPTYIQNIIIEGYRKMPLCEKMRQVSELNKTVQQFSLARIRKQYGKTSKREEKLRLASLWLDRDIMIRVFNWDPREKGY